MGLEIGVDGCEPRRRVRREEVDEGMEGDKRGPAAVIGRWWRQSTGLRHVVSSPETFKR